VLANTKEHAKKEALDESGADDVYHVDGPYQDSEPGVWEFEYVTEHRERVVVEAPNEDYARETADNQRDYRGQLVQTVHETSRRVSDKYRTEEDRE